MTQIEIARAIGSTQSAVSDIESGVNSNPGIRVLQRYADALGLDLVLKLRNTV